MAKDREGAAVAGAAKGTLRNTGVSLCLGVCALMALSFLLGAAVIFYRWPPSNVLGDAFSGGLQWWQRGRATAAAPPPPPAVRGVIDDPARTFDGFTLYAYASLDGQNTHVYLMNMHRDVVHQWDASFSRVWPLPPHVPGLVSDDRVYVIGCRLFPNGDLLVVFHGMDVAACGFGLARLDKDSNLLWKYAGHVHHDVDVGEEGTIYAVEHEFTQTTPDRLEFIPPGMVDRLVLLSPDGTLKKTVPILEALRDSPYSVLLDSLRRGGPFYASRSSMDGPPVSEDDLRKDALHVNSIHLLTPELASRFPGFKAGQVLISLRHLDALAVMDVETGAVVWAARGPWRAQHDPQFLDNGRLLIFDNRGLPTGSRVLEYDPQSQAIPWSYSGENSGPFYTADRGMCQRLPNGNTLIVDSEGGELREVTRDKDVVWSFLSPKDATSATGQRFISTARRYSPGQLHFLKENERARP
ncbi:MAG TPA: arylsulfotransferase family protein [Gemmataceae bacterium]|nr:arylsulfotransferase family protein [Gemmataceae bacterium]